jgi:hypothetical protein
LIGALLSVQLTFPQSRDSTGTESGECMGGGAIESVKQKTHNGDGKSDQMTEDRIGRIWSGLLVERRRSPECRRFAFNVDDSILTAVGAAAGDQRRSRTVCAVCG